MPTFQQKLAGAVYGVAIGDAMGAPVEGWPAEKIALRFDSVRRFLPPTHGGDPALGKGDGRFTDDTLMVEALLRAYVAHGDHLDAYDFERYMLPEMTRADVWVPERGREMPIIDRLWWPEKYPWVRLTMSRAEPRAAGRGNCVNCGVAMYIMPVGAVNAGDPAGAYEEAASFAAAHNESYAIEAAAVMAGACARAFAADGAIDNVLGTAMELARDGTGRAIRAVVGSVRAEDDLPAFIARAREAMVPFDVNVEHTADDTAAEAPAVAGGGPSRLHSIEELPVALAALKYGAGDFEKTIHAAVFYGRDCDSIAGMAGGLFGAIYGIGAIPEELRLASDRANRRDWRELLEKFGVAAESILARDERRLAARRAALGG